jgi:type VI protein secretion system component VasF
MRSPDRSPSLARELAPWVLGALLVVGLVVVYLMCTAPETNLLHRDYEIL